MKEARPADVASRAVFRSAVSKFYASRGSALGHQQRMSGPEPAVLQVGSL
jgi:hypothetical protein